MTEEPPKHPTTNDDPPEIEDQRPRSLILLACGIIIALLLLLVVINLDRDQIAEPGSAPGRDTPLVVVPEPLSEEEMARGSTPQAETPIRGIAAGGWIQIADEEGELAQQYRCASVDPDPEDRGPGWLEMVRPELEIYLSDGRIASLTGAKALAYAPNRMIESGTVTGDVQLRLLHPVEGRTAPSYEPRMILRTEEAVFDNILGEIECAGSINIETTSVEFAGEQLKISINDEAEVVQRLEVARVAYIRIAGLSEADEQDAHATAAPVSDRAEDRRAEDHDRLPQAARVHTPRESRAVGNDEAGRSPAAARHAGEGRESAPRSGESAGVASDAADAVFYLMTLRDNVRIQRGEGSEASTAIGDVLALVFTMEGEGTGELMARGTDVDTPRSRRAGAPGARFRRTPTHTLPVAGPARETAGWLWKAVVGTQSEAATSLAPPPSADDTVVYCDGRLTMVPAPPEARKPSSADDALLQLTGDPVLLHDGGARAQVSCATLAYDTGTSQLDLMRSAEHELTVFSPELHAKAERFWLRRENGEGGFTGPGSIDFLRSSYATLEREKGEPSEVEDFAEHLHVEWTRAVDLEFDPGADRGDLGPLRRAVLSGDVRADGHRLTLGGSNEPGGEGHEAPGGQQQPASIDKPGLLRGEEVRLAFGENPQGEQVLERLIATGDVEVSDEQQTLWARTLDATFGDAGDATQEPAPDTASTTDTASMATGGDDAEREFGRLQTAIARGDVQLLMSNGARAFADRFEVTEGGDRAELTGRRVSVVDGAGFIDEAERITIDADRRRYDLHGSGLFSQFNEPLLPEGAGKVAQDRLDDLRAAAGLQEQLRITWKDGVEIRPDEMSPELPAPEASPQIVRFIGDVYVNSPELRLDHADELEVIVASAREHSGIKSLEARGGVSARSAGEPGEIHAELLHVAMETTEEGSARPHELRATGGVHVADETQHLWSESLQVTFEEATDAAEGGRGGEDVEATGTESGMTFVEARVEVDELRAFGAVQLLLEDGRRVFADELLADAGEETAELHGEQILVVSRDFVIDAENTLTLEKKAGRVEIVGPGEAWGFAEPVTVTDVVQPIDRPVLTGAKTMEARWSTSASYTQTPGASRAPGEAGEGAGRPEEDRPVGVFELHGDVLARSTPSPLELNVAEADHLTLELLGTRNGDDPEAGNHELRRLLARGDAQLESRKWMSPDHADVPQVFYIAGDHIDFDQIAQTATVIGAGELLIRDERGADDGRDNSAVGFDARGATSFKWTEGLTLTPDVDDLFDIEMEGDVSCLHRDVAGENAQLWAQRVEATVQRLAAEEAPRAEEGPQARQSEGAAIDLGGPMELRRLHASGGVSVRTPDRDVACDEFEYNPVTGIARAAARPGRTVSILSTGSGRPMRAESILWNMREDTITILRGRGSGVP